MTLLDYLNRLKALAPRPSVYAVAKMLQLPEERVRHWYKGRARPDTYTCVRIAQLLDVDPMQVIADVEAEREKDEGRKARWRELARKLSGSALVVICSTTSLIADYSPVQPVRPFSATSLSAAFRIMSTALSRLLQRLCPRRFGRFPAFGS